MRRNELLNQVSELFQKECGIEVYAVLKQNDQKYIKLLNIKDENEQDNNSSIELMDGFMDAIERSLYVEDEQEILKLSTADDRKNTIYYYDLDELPFEFQALKNITNYSEQFDFKDDSLNNIQGFIVQIGTQNESVVIYKQHYPISLLNRDKYMLTPVPYKNRLKKFDGDILRIDFNCQFMLWQNMIYIFDVDKMEKICSFTDIIINEAKKSIEMISKISIVDDIESLNDELDNMTFARKLTRVYKDSKVIGKVSNEAIIRFSQTHSFFIKNPIKLNEYSNKFILDTKRSKNAFLKLLNDDLLTSQLTEADYESLAKNEA